MNGPAPNARAQSSSGSAENARRFHNPALADPEGAKEYLDREWSRAAITRRYEWLFTYDVLGAQI
jgi:salicylate hydroxylase